MVCMNMMLMYLVSCSPVRTYGKENIITCEINTSIGIFSNIVVKNDVIYRLEKY